MLAYELKCCRAAAMPKRCFMRGAFDLIHDSTTWVKEPAGPSYVQTISRSNKYPNPNTTKIYKPRRQGL